MRSLLLLWFVLGWTSMFYAQTPDLFVYMADGKVKYSAADGYPFQRLRAGSIIEPEGRLQFKRNSSIGIVANDVFATFDASGQITVADLLDDGSAFRESAAASIFSDQLERANDPFFTSVELVRSGFATKPKSDEVDEKPPMKKTSSGHGNKNFPIVRVQPTGGKVTPGPLTFRWTDPEVKRGTYRFELRDQTEAVLLNRTVKGESLTVNPSEYAFQADTKYSWQVFDIDNEERMSSKVTFECVPGKQRTEWLDQLESDPMYQSANASTRQMLEGVYLEYKEYWTAAGERYEEAKRNDKRNPLAQDMYEAFLYYFDILPTPK